VTALEPYLYSGVLWPPVGKRLGGSRLQLGRARCFNQEIGEWSYSFGCASAAVAIVYRALWFGSLGPRLFGSPRVAPHHLMDLSILLFVVSIASNVHAIVHREDSKAAIRRVA
jgi:hypothetical protein